MMSSYGMLLIYFLPGLASTLRKGAETVVRTRITREHLAILTIVKSEE